MGVVRFIRGLSVRSRAPWGSFGLSGVVGFTLGVVGLIRCCWAHLRAPPGGRWVKNGSFGSLARALGVDSFIWCRSVHAGAPFV